VRFVPIAGGTRSVFLWKNFNGDVSNAATGAVGLAADSTGVYWSPPGSVLRSTDDGSQSIPVGGGNAFAIAADGVNVYWVGIDATGTSFVREAPIATQGVGTLTIASGPPNPGAIAVDATNVYWINYGDNSVWKAPK
jgi:hypothetical protein